MSDRQPACADCGTTLPAAARFCHNCGTRVAVVTPIARSRPAFTCAPPVAGDVTFIATRPLSRSGMTALPPL